MEISEENLYRIITLTKGQFRGDYRLYWNTHICKLFEPEPYIVKWGDCEAIKASDWIETYDGTVLQCLDRRNYYDKRKWNRHFIFIRTPIATVYIWQTKAGYKYRQLFGNFMSMNRHKMTTGTTLAGSDNQKIRFATYMISGLNPLKAYRLAFNNFATLPVTTLHRRVNQMITDDIVKKEITDQLEPLYERLNTEFSDDKLVKELGILLQASRKGSDAHRENIKFIMALLNKLPQALYPGSKTQKSIALETKYTEVPQLGVPK